MRFGRVLLLPVALCLAGKVAAQPVRPAVSQCHIYSVIHRVVVDRYGRITDVSVDRIIDPTGVGTEEEVARRPIQLELPSAYLAAVREFLDRQRYSGERGIFYTFTFYNPARPNAADVDPRECGWDL